jgi:hypothetical protein
VALLQWIIMCLIKRRYCCLVLVFISSEPKSCTMLEHTLELVEPFKHSTERVASAFFGEV